jgi:hypothetical protein
MLEARLAEAAARDGGLFAAREVLVRPLRLLSLMGADVVPALGDGVLEAERLRMLLHLAAPFHSLVEEAQALEEAAGTSGRAAAGAYQPGVIDHAGLALLGLAAMRVAPPGSEALFLRTVHGLALSAAPAEALGRLAPALPGPDGLVVILDTLYLLDTAGSALKAPFLRPFAGDPAERGRWRCLSRLMQQRLPAAVSEALAQAKLPANKAPPWDGAYADPFEEVEPLRAAPGQGITLSGRLERLGRGKSLPEGLQVVFAAPGRDPLVAKVVAFKPGSKAGELRVEVPAKAEPGWVGLCDDALVEASNQFRSALNAQLPKVLGGQDCLRGAELPAQAVPLIGVADPGRPGKLLAVPPRLAGNRWLGPADAEARALALVVRRSEPTTAVVTSVETHVASGIKLLPLRVRQDGRAAPFWQGRPLEVEALVDPSSSLAVEAGQTGRLAAWLVTDPPGTEPLAADEARSAGLRFHFTLGAERLSDQMTVAVVLCAAQTDPDDTTPAGSAGTTPKLTTSYKSDVLDRRSVGPLTIREPRALTVVLVRAQVAEPLSPAVEEERARGWVRTAARVAGIDAEIVTLPWIDDELAVLGTPLASGEDGRVPLLLEALSRRAVLTSRLEGALWLLLVPPVTSVEDPDPDPDQDVPRMVPIGTRAELELEEVDVPPGLAVSAPAVAAWAVAVADECGLAPLFSQLLPPDVAMPLRPGTSTRLRLLGTFDGSEVTLDPVMQETRGAGPGGPLDSGLVAVGLDAAGQQRVTTRITCLREGRPALLAALVPVTADVVEVQVRRDHRVLERVRRTLGEPRLSQVTLLEATGGLHALRWAYEHTGNVRPVLSFGLRRGLSVTEVRRFGPCECEPVLTLTRYGNADGMQLNAGDGWNTAQVLAHGEGSEEPAQNDNSDPVVIRRVSERVYFADVPRDWPVRWSFDGVEKSLGDDQVLKLTGGQSGTLVLEAKAPNGQSVYDEVEVA